MQLTGKVEGESMDSISYTAARRNLAKAMEESADLLRSGASALNLLESVAELEVGKV